MPKRPPVPTIDDELDFEDPRLAGKDPTLIPGHPLCNYTKYLATCETADIVMQPDYENRQIKTFRMSFNGHPSPEYTYGQMHLMPWPFAVQAMLTGRASTSNAKLLREVNGQVADPKEGPQPGPISGMYAGEKF